MSKMLYVYVGIIGIFILTIVIPGVYAFSMSSGGYSSSSSTSFDSSSGLSSTSVSTVSSPSQNQQPSMQQSLSPKFQIPPSWILDVNTASFYDPVTNTAWIFDRVLQKFYSPNIGWYLVSLYPNKPSPTVVFEQFYYNPVTREFFDVVTGLPLKSNPLISRSSVPQTSGGTPSQATPSSVETSTSMTTTGFIDDKPIVAGGLGEEAQGSFQPYIYYPEDGGVSENAQDEAWYYECPIISCSDCYEGYCLDCDGDNMCDGEML